MDSLIQSDSTATLALIGILGTVITALFKLLSANTKALVKVADSSEKVAQATTKGAKEAKERNGHLGDIASKTLEVATRTLASLEKSAKLAEKAQANGGLLVKTKEANPLDVKVKE